MKRIVATICGCLMAMLAFAQFVGSGGTGTEGDPYLIGNYADLKEFNTFLDEHGQYTNTEGKHFRLIADIEMESDYWVVPNDYQNCQDFYGFFHGGGHRIFLPDTTIHYPQYYDIGFCLSIFPSIFGVVDSIIVMGNVNYMFGLAMKVYPNGEIRDCITDVNVTISNNSRFPLPIEVYFISEENYGKIVNCTNYGNTIVESNVGNECYDNFYFCMFGSIAFCNNRGEIIGCKNYGNTVGFFGAGGICCVNAGTIRKCENYGDIIAPADVTTVNAFYPCGGIYALSDGLENGEFALTEECINYGYINAGKLYNGGGIVGGGSISRLVDDPDNIIYHSYCEERIIRCANYGEVAGGGYTGGIVGYIYSISNVSSCFNAGQVARATNSGGIVGMAFDTIRIANNLDVSGFPVTLGRWCITGDSISNMSSNYYDRQMSGGSGEDIEGETEGRFTSQLTGDTPELRAMLGDGWSYAEGRYPIPLGLENDSLAMLYATPIYLREISDDNYDHTNLVRNNFTVGTENGVSWSSGDRLSIDGENATILASGSETATASLAGYSFSRSLRLDPITGELVATDCDSYLWNGDEYTASGDYIQVLTASNGCDSIVTLHLTINNSVYYSFTETATSPYAWNGIEYTETGDYTQNFTAANGCDSIVTLHLNILSGISQNGTAEISVFPTPATDILNITSSETISEIEIVNVMGQVLKRMEVNADNVVCYVEDLKAGVYVVRIHAGGTVVSQRKFVKK